MKTKKKSSYMEKRLLQNNKNKVSKARVAIFIAGGFYLLFGLYCYFVGVNYLNLGTLSLLIIIPLSSIVLFLGYWSIRRPVLAFQIAIIPIVLLTLLIFHFLLAIFMTGLIWSIYHGIGGARAIEKKLPEWATNILDEEEVLR